MQWTIGSNEPLPVMSVAGTYAMMRLRYLIPFLVFGCSGAEESPPPPVPTPEVERLTPTEHLVRASIALRGFRPTIDEVRRVQEEPGLVPAFVDFWLETPSFGRIVRNLHAETLLTRADTLKQFPAAGVLADYSTAQIHASTAEAPLRLVEDIVMSDRPYTELVTADYILADEILAKAYGLPFDFDGPEWQTTWWVDGRPAAGVLSSSEIFKRFQSNGTNYNRGRASIVSEAFLCDDIAKRSVIATNSVFTFAPEDVANLVQTDELCLGCHVSLEPLASFFWGFQAVYPLKAMHGAYRGDPRGECYDTFVPGSPPPGSGFVSDMCYPLISYRPSDEDTWSELELPRPALYGVPGRDIGDLGRMIAADPSFATCTARRFFGYMNQTSHKSVPDGVAEQLAADFVASGYNAKKLARAVVLGDAFTRRSAPEDSDEGVGVGLHSVRALGYAQQIEHLTGYQWLTLVEEEDCGLECWGVVDLARSDVFGYRALAGGIDSIQSVEAVHTPTPSKVLVMWRFASEAAGFVVERDFGKAPAERRLLTLVEPTTTDEALIRTQLAELHGRILSELVEPDSEVVDATWGLYQTGLEHYGTTEGAWEMVISALLQDPQMVLY